MKKIFFILFVIACFISCKSEVNTIVDKSIEVSGGDFFDQKKITFDFRDKKYISTKKGSIFSLERITADSINITKDIFNNDGFKRYINNKIVEVPDTMAIKYANSVNSVHYFAYLPYGLNDSSVKNELLGEVKLKGKDYFKVKVWFSYADSEVGDVEDVYLYWINKETFFVDYLAYKYKVDSGGMRFREAYNPRIINGIRFVDYNNYKPKSKSVDFFILDSLFETKELEKVSVIELKNVTVESF